MRFERYECYKDSGLEWLGEIPCEWGVKRLKDIFKYFGSGSTPLSTNKQYYDDGIIPWLNTTDIRNNIVNSTKYKISKLAFSKLNMKIYPKNSLAIGMYGQGETRGNVAILNIEVTTNQNAGIMSKFINSDSKFIFWWFIGRKKHIRQIGNVATIPNLNKDIIRNLFIALPPLKTQTKITTYLDTKTKKIDKEIALLEQKIEKYRELKQTLINETVLRGLDKNIKFKTKRLKDILYLSTGNSIANKEDYENNDIKVYSYIATKDINVDTNEINYKNGIYIPQNNNTFKILKEETTLLCIEGGSAGKKIGFTNQKICLVNKLCAFKSKNNSINDKFIFYNINSVLFKNQFFAEMGGVIGGVSIGIIRNFIIHLPPLKEQIQIANYLDEKTQKIDNITQIISKKIELLKEFRKTLINDVVTGRVKVDKNEI